MNNISNGKNYIDDAKIIFSEAIESSKIGHYHRTIRKCQEAVKLGEKGLLRIVGVEYPKSHRVGKVLVNSPLNDKVDPEVLKTIARITDMLALEREVAFYGTEQKPAHELFTNTDAENVIEDSKVSSKNNIFDRGFLVLKCISYWSFEGGIEQLKPLDEALLEAQRAGYDGIELTIGKSGMMVQKQQR